MNWKTQKQPTKEMIVSDQPNVDSLISQLQTIQSKGMMAQTILRQQIPPTPQVDQWVHEMFFDWLQEEVDSIVEAYNKTPTEN